MAYALYDVFYTRNNGALSSECDFRTASLPRVPREAPHGSLARQVTGEEILFVAVDGDWKVVTKEEYGAAWRTAKAKRAAGR